MLVSQDLFDETLLESQELFEYDDDQAVQETISELQSGSNTNVPVRLDHLSLTHPNSEQGQQERKLRADFVDAVRSNNFALATKLLIENKLLLAAQGLMLQQGLLSVDSNIFACFTKGEDEVKEVVNLLLTLIPEVATAHPLARQVKLQLGQPLQDEWCRLYQDLPDMKISLLNLARVCCNACEPNKKTLVQAALRFRCPEDSNKNGLDLLIRSLPADLAGELERELAKEICLLVTVLCKFQASVEPAPLDGQPPLVSSAHANVLELHKIGAVSKLHRLAKQAEEDQLRSVFLAALRVMAIDNDIVQNMVAVGILETANTSLQACDDSPPLAAATLGLLRNLCANDEIKSSVCKRSLGAILHAMETHALYPSVQEHGCGILAAMPLRQPQNAVAIVEANGPHHILTAMRTFPTKVPLQRQGCLAIRNLAVRLTLEQKQILLDAGAENVLKDIAGRHQGSIEEAYAALRDLGCAAVMQKLDENGKMQGTQLFGSVESNFRPVYD